MEKKRGLKFLMSRRVPFRPQFSPRISPVLAMSRIVFTYFTSCLQYVPHGFYSRCSMFPTCPQSCAVAGRGAAGLGGVSPCLHTSRTLRAASGGCPKGQSLTCTARGDLRELSGRGTSRKVDHASGGSNKEHRIRRSGG